jgi:hypothetical protein
MVFDAIANSQRLYKARRGLPTTEETNVSLAAPARRHDARQPQR